MDFGTILRHYKREDIQKEIVESSKDREIAIKFGDKGFGKRPDILKYPRDIMELAKQGATSFHASEELWFNPLHIAPDMKQKDVERLRKGWDFVLDVDFLEWNSTKLITDALIKTLKKHGVKSITCKFSGNKGFHIGVPFEAFPKKIMYDGQLTETRLLFPEGVRRIAMYLMDLIDNKDNDYELSKKISNSQSFQQYLKENNKNIEEFSKEICSNCGKEIKQAKKQKTEFICENCDNHVSTEEETKFMVCPKCKKIMKKIEHNTKSGCKTCKNSNIIKKIDLAIDTLLISNRHLFRGLYSLHEKSGLVSIPIDPDKVLEFEKINAHPNNVQSGKYPFLDRTNVKEEEGKMLIIEAFDYKPKIEEEVEKKPTQEYFELQEAIPEDFFPPCVNNIFKGLKDGKKRSMFVLVNFLSKCGWSYDMIEARLKEWNKVNEEPIRETILMGQLRHYKQRKEKILPPNCENQMYYKDLRICTPDNLCKKIKNPVNYSIIKVKAHNQENKKRKKPKKPSSENEKRIEKTQSKKEDENQHNSK